MFLILGCRAANAGLVQQRQSSSAILQRRFRNRHCVFFQASFNGAVETIRILGARQHNLRNIDVTIPRGRLVVITGPSGCGKSSLAFDTLYAEGRRRYVESLSAYARQFLEQLEKPDVDRIDGLSPAIAIEQRSGGLNPRSTVATVTEIHDFLRIWWAAEGIPHDPVTGMRLERMTPEEITASLTKFPDGTKLVLLAPIPSSELSDPIRLLADLKRQGFVRVRVDGDILDMDEAGESWPEHARQVELVVDRLVVRSGVESRLADSVEAVLRHGGVEARVALMEPGAEGWRDVSFQTAYRNPRTGEVLETLTPKHFSFNSHLGACEACGGLGEQSGTSHGRAGSQASEVLSACCPICGGGRLKPAWQAVRMIGRDGEAKGIQEFCAMSISSALDWLHHVTHATATATVCEPLVEEVRKRLSFLCEVGLDYLTLDRRSATLSGGEAQRIRLASQLGAALTGVIYVLDEPSIGLHPADTARLLGALGRLRDLGNTVVVVEHDEAVIRAADLVIDMGPGAGNAGGTVLDCANPAKLQSPTGRWLAGEWTPTLHPKPSGAAAGKLVIRQACEHNLRGIDVTIPLGKLVCLCGPSGSGKSTLADDILRRALARYFHRSRELPGRHERIDGIETLGGFVVADQSPIGRSPRSNPATFCGIFDVIRSLFRQLPLARQRGYSSARFSFNAGGGRCERCLGNGKLKVEMHFLPDAWVDCPACNGRRFNRETLEVTYKGHSIADILDLSVADALALFRPVPKVASSLAALDDLGLGYLRLGQPAHTLSGGEAQRLKLAAELAKTTSSHTLYLFDEPTTGLHFGDVDRLVTAMVRLRDAGHSLLVVEHHPDVLAAADWLIELGPGGGELGGTITACGTPEDLAAGNSPGAMAIRSALQRRQP